MKFGALVHFVSEKLVALKYKQWETPFSHDNIPSNIINKSFHITMGAATGKPANQHVHSFSVPITLRLFFDGFKSPVSGMQTALDDMDAVLGAVLSPAVRLSGSGLADIRPVSVQPFPLSTSNEHCVYIEIVLDCLLNFKF